MSSDQEANQLFVKSIEHLKKNEFKEAEMLLKQANDLLPSNMSILTNLGFCQTQLGKIDKAREHLLAANKLDPKHDQILINLGFLEMRAEKFKDAIAHLSQIDLTNSNSAGMALRNLGLCELQLAHFPEAIAYFEKSIDRGFEVIENKIDLALTYFGMNQFDVALGILDEALEASPSHRRASMIKRTVEKTKSKKNTDSSDSDSA